MQNMERQKVVTVSISRSLLIVLLLAAFSFGAFLGRGTVMFGTAYDDGNDEPANDPSGNLQFIRPRLEHWVTKGGRAPRELKPFRYKVAALIDRKVKAGDASSIAVFFRDLTGGFRFGINDHEPLSPESLLKLPLMIAYFKWAESNPHALRRKLTYTPGDVPADRQTVRSIRPLEAGKSYTVDDLILRMIAYDDSDAHALLMSNLPPDYLDRIFKDIYVNYDPAKKDDAVTFSAYTSFFRVLYDASYLSKEMSGKALRYLSRSSFRDEFVSNIPPNVECAIKFGTRILGDDAAGDRTGELEQFHEVGIVYYPGRPYLMGIMARGKDTEKLKSAIREITTLIYEEVDRQLR